MVGKGASVAPSLADSGGALEGSRWKGTGRRDFRRCECEKEVSERRSV